MSTKKTTTVLDAKNFSNAFARLSSERISLNATLRNIAALTATDAAWKVLAKFVGITSSKVTSKDVTDIRQNIMNEVVYYTTSEDVNVQPVMMSKIATVNDVNYYTPKAVTWQTAIKMICSRKNKGLDSKHTLLEANAIYTASGDVVTDAKILNDIQKYIDDKVDASEILKYRKAVVASGDVAKIREIADEIEGAK